MSTKSQAANEFIQAGACYLARKRISAGHGSSLRKLIRGHRIALGLRPERMPTKRAPIFVPGLGEFPCRLHPTKGFRFGGAV
ncbi:hypothetical protein [Methylobacterium sp. WCS2018Hpa-22]|uniref:hypothetical protein n=1 Tax=Methylobacterium sp. WCS2018Hpa-22 TaxID=3073633 RepID=UPI00288C0DC2|nr:hypothetical protein [Methylobacterium sp. WCS2018Hpa-22]